MAKVLVAILAGFVVAIPSTFWLLKKVRIKSKVRHFQVSLALGLPTALFIYLLQTSFALPIVITTVVLSLLVIALELTLRRVVASLPSTSARTFGMHRTGASVPLDEARNASGYYPYDYFTEDFMTEVHVFGQSRQTQLANFTRVNGQVPSQKSYLAFKDMSFKSKYFSMTNGIRRTTDRPSGAPRARVFILGASTVFCIEVPDNLTISSYLQRMVNLTHDEIQVLNYGMAGATVVDRCRMMIDFKEIRENDSVIFYFGGADAGWQDHRSGKLSQQLIPLPIRALRGLSDFGLETARFLYIELSPAALRKYSNLAVSDTIEALTNFKLFCLDRGAQMFAILQPNIYTLQTKTAYEKILEKRFSRDMKTLIREAYKKYEDWIKVEPNAVSATHIFNNAQASVFLDWAHTNALGNELIAKFIYSELINRKSIGDLKKV